MLDIYQDLSAALRRGVIDGRTSSGCLRVREERTERILTCEVLNLTAGPPPVFSDGADVVFLAAADEEQGYVLGVLEPPDSSRHDIATAGMRSSVEPAVIKLTASQRLEFTCGRASLTMNADGTVVLKGVTVVSRASGVNKIRGAAVRIN